MRVVCRMWTLSHTAVPGPISTPASMMAVGWIETVIRYSLYCCKRAMSPLTAGMSTADSGPMVLTQHGVCRFNHFNGGQGVFDSNEEPFLTADGFGKIVDLVPKGLEFIVPLAKDHPVATGGLAILRLLPADRHGAVRPIDIDIAIEFLVDAPRQIDTPHDAADTAHKNAYGFFDGESLAALALHHVYFGEGAKEIAHEINRMGAVIDQHATTTNLGVRIPPRGHIDPRGKGVFK